MRILLLGKDHLPSLKEVYVHIHREEGRQGVINVTTSFKKSTLVSASTRGDRGDNTRRGRGGRVNLTSNDRD